MFMSIDELTKEAGLDPSGPYGKDDIETLAMHLASKHNSDVLHLVSVSQLKEDKLELADELIQVVISFLDAAECDPSGIDEYLPLLKDKLKGLALSDKYAKQKKPDPAPKAREGWGPKPK